MEFKIKCDKNNIRNILNQYSLIISIMFNLKQREIELISRLMYRYYSAYIVNFEEQYAKEYTNGPISRQLMCEEMNLSRGVYRTMLYGLRKKRILNEDNSFILFIQKLLVSLPKENEITVTYKFILNG